MNVYRHVHFTVQIRNDLVCGPRPFRIANMDWFRAMGLAMIYPILLMGVRNWVICWGYKRERIRLKEKNDLANHQIYDETSNDAALKK